VINGVGKTFQFKQEANPDSEGITDRGKAQSVLQREASQRPAHNRKGNERQQECNAPPSKIENPEEITLTLDAATAGSILTPAETGE